jgi:hypothetical protein
MDLRECGDVDCIHLAQDSYQWRALVHKVMRFRVLQHFVKLLGSGTAGGFLFIDLGCWLPVWFVSRLVLWCSGILRG